MKLALWLASHQVTDRSFAEKIGVDRSTVTKLKKGNYNAPIALLQRVYEATAGSVTPNDFIVERAEGCAAPSQASAA